MNQSIPFTSQIKKKNTNSNFGWVKVSIVNSATGKMGQPSLNPLNNFIIWNIQTDNNSYILLCSQVFGLIECPWKS